MIIGGDRLDQDKRGVRNGAEIPEHDIDDASRLHGRGTADDIAVVGHERAGRPRREGDLAVRCGGGGWSGVGAVIRVVRRQIDDGVATRASAPAIGATRVAIKTTTARSPESIRPEFRIIAMTTSSGIRDTLRTADDSTVVNILGDRRAGTLAHWPVRYQRGPRSRYRMHDNARQ